MLYVNRKKRNQAGPTVQRCFEKLSSEEQLKNREFQKVQHLEIVQDFNGTKNSVEKTDCRTMMDIARQRPFGSPTELENIGPFLEKIIQVKKTRELKMYIGL